MKTATSKNVQNLQETVQAQQAYMTVLLGHIAVSHTKLVHLDKQIQIHCIYPHPQSDAVQLNALDYDPDIDGEPNPINAIQPLSAATVDSMARNQPSESDRKAQEKLQGKVSDFQVTFDDNVPQSQKTILPFTLLAIGLSISPQQLAQIARTLNLTMQNNNEQNTRVITAHN